MKQNEAFEAVYADLRALAGAQMSKERANHTLSPTALVHDAFIRLAQRGDATYNDKEHFFRVAAEAMRRTLIDHARTKKRKKRGGAFNRLGIDEADIADSFSGREFDSDDLVSLAEALERLEAEDPQLARIVDLKFFSDASMAEIASIIGVSERGLYNDWKVARQKLKLLMPE